MLEADPKFKDRFYSPAAVGNRSDHEFHLCARLWEEGFNFDEIWRLMDSSPQTKWRERDDTYKEGTIWKAISAARSSEKDRGRGERSAGDVRVERGAYVADLPGGERLRVSCKKENWFVEVSGGTFKPAQISDKPIWFDNRKWEKLPEKMGIDPDLWDQIRGDVRRLEERRQADEKARAEEEGGGGPATDPDVIKEADKILSAGLAFEHLYDVWQSRHLGDAKVGKALLGGFGAQRCVSTSGIHIQINGPREAGKSHSVEVAVDLLPPRLVMMGSMSNMTLYYDAENMPAGAAVSIDDITYTETFGAVQKRCTTGFQTGATHRSVVDSKDGKVVKKFTTKPRMAFYTTCVDRQQDEQLRSRIWSIDADSSPEHKQAVIDFRKRKDAGLLFDPADEERKTAVCRAIFEDLDSHLFDVVIPFAERLITSPGLDVRSYNVISDLTKSLAVYRYRVREKDDRGRVLATEKDFFDAKAIFDATEGHSDIKFTDAELRVLEALIDLGFKASMSDLCRKTGLQNSRIDEILKGRGKGEQKRHGLMSKAPITREQESDSWVYDYDPETRESKRKTVTQFIYYLAPSFRLQGYKSLIKLETDNGGEVSGAFRRVSVVVSVDDTDNNKEVSGVSVEKTREGEDSIPPLRGDVGKDRKDISPNTIPGKTTETPESPSPLAVPTTETSPETPGKVRKPPEPKGDEGERLKLRAIYRPKGAAAEYAKYALNLYRGCGHGCVYCYNKDLFNGNPSDRVNKSSLDAIGADLQDMDAAGEKGPVHLSFVGDPCDLTRGEDDTRAVLELFHKSKVNFQVLTKGGTKAARDFDLYRPGDLFACTLTFIDPEKSKTWEPGAALPDDRLRALEEAHKRGIETWASLEPVIEPEETLELIRRSHKFVDHFKVGRWNHDKRADEIDWHKFTAEAVALLDSLGCDYYIKDGLRRYLPAERSAPKKDDIEEGRVFGLTHAYYRDLQRQTGGLSIKVLMDNQGWDRDRADIAMGLLRVAGVVL
ncbi:radical SAM protein [Methanotrichaceae archaeon M04Ac]|uniref:Radical SAM protein n=1 Tax=Candidatus Methanocrinis alkalitolerans TaxID=3033395 RepID=A0ABT5XI46_9EURY|nr:radical SAM protein [Candidatus Methanocrinis alkalitolerans]MDF0594298.1 radical SAM protein [Candidatus Methanocrinis alkalitolerans]